MLVQTRSQFRKQNCEMDYKTFLQYNRRTVRSTISHRRKKVAGEKNVKMNAAAAVERNEDNEMTDALQLNDATADLHFTVSILYTVKTDSSQSYGLIETIMFDRRISA
ncbi:uncharacterized protein [Nicotiana tomentosiformis]|uniref:uncharacterized protein n=1 Tax=Nicotiana tomentosiformis TaxID=4098 RepID=UPI00087813E2|nr:uncharacterized protein LOC108947581 [Nicotiana tomentosiformis]